ncbi:MAG: hypothetical protein JOY80_07360, partial [Candidatus Dormibacteraeota bacterium]|nr:hypothetical protein [Candidatus Dormibacteraeota bacterium]
MTATAGAAILALAAVELLTVPFLRGLLSVHFFVGVMLLGPAAVKTASTGWRFARYYMRSPAYQRKGPPHPLQRALAPVLLVSTFVLVGSGIALAIAGPAPTVLIRVHVLSFLVWIVTLVVHVVAYLRPVARLTASELNPSPDARTARRRRQRWWANVVALVMGAVAALFV